MLFGSKGAVTADSIDGLISSRGDEPGCRIVWETIRSPPGQSRHPRFLEGVLGRVEVAQVAHQGRQRSTPHLAVKPGGLGFEILGAYSGIRTRPPIK